MDRRWDKKMNIHEYQAKKILNRYGIYIPRGKIAYTPNEAKKSAIHVSMRGPWMLKAQIQSGARAKGHFLEAKAGSKGGIRQVKRRREIAVEAEKMLGATLCTPQTGPKGKFVSRNYVEAFQKVEKNFISGWLSTAWRQRLRCWSQKLKTTGKTLPLLRWKIRKKYLNFPWIWNTAPARNKLRRSGNF